MLQLNEFGVIGRITHDLDLQSGKKTPYLNFQVAVPREYRKDQEEQESDFLNAVAFSGTAEFIDQYFGKGSPIYLKGRIQSSEYDDDEGNKRRSFTLIVEKAKFVQSKKEAEAAVGEGSDDNEDRGSRSAKSGKKSGSKSSGGGKNTGKSGASSGGGKGGGAAKGIPFDPDDDDDLPF